MGDQSHPKPRYGGIFPVALNAIVHPITYVKVLIQVGHEPLPAVEGRTLFGRKVMKLPNFVKYAAHIQQVDGWLGLYRGLGPRITYHVVNSAITNAITSRVNEENASAGKLAVDPSFLSGYMQETANLAVAKTCGVIMSYPFHLISVRMMVQFVGKEEHYSSVLSSIRQIYHEEGLSGFFTGLFPHLLAELTGLCMLRALNYIIVNYIINKREGDMVEFRTYSQAISQYFVGMITYPFHLVSNMMAINDKNLAAGCPPMMPIYSSWTDCWIDLGKQGLRSRGSSLFRRYIPAVPFDVLHT